MCAIILHLTERKIRATKVKRPANPIILVSGTYTHENFYFGDWIPLRNSTGQIVGFKIVPFVNDEYLQRRILSAKFVKQATNVSIEKSGRDTYFYVVLAQGQSFEEDKNQYIEAAIFHNQKDDFIVRLDGFRDGDWGQLGFEFTEMMAEPKLWQ